MQRNEIKFLCYSVLYDYSIELKEDLIWRIIKKD